MGKEQMEYFFQSYYSLVFRVAFMEVKTRADAEDILMEVYMKLLRYNPEFENPEHERAWIVRTTINLCKDFMKSKWNNATVGLESVSESERKYLKLPYQKEDETIWRLLELPTGYRQPLYLFYYEDYSIKEIAAILEISENTVKTHLKRGREKLKKLLMNGGNK